MSWPSVAKQKSITLPAQPSGPGKMAVIGSPGPLGMLTRIDMQHDP